MPLTSNAAPGLVVLNPTFLLTVSKYNVELFEASSPNCITLPVSEISEFVNEEPPLHFEIKLAVPEPVTPPLLPFAAAVTQPLASTVIFAFVYEPAVTPELPKFKTTDWFNAALPVTSPPPAENIVEPVIYPAVLES